MRVSFIVSAFERPVALKCLLASLAAQTETDFEVIVTDNSNRLILNTHTRAVCEDYWGDMPVQCQQTRLANCYASANYGAKLATGDYLCFPSDDGIYGAKFLERMLEAAPAELIYCDCIYEGHGWKYSPLYTKPQLRFIDKGGFLVKRERFTGFSESHPEADGMLIDSLVASGISHQHVPGFLWIHQ